MTTPKNFSKEGYAETDLENEISQLRSVKKELLNCLRPFNDVLERITQRERERVDIQHLDRAEKHDREKQKQAVEQLIEVQAELKRVNSENVKLKQSLDQAEKYSKTQKLRFAELKSRVTVLERERGLRTAAAAEARSQEDTSTIRELQKQLHEAREQLNKTTEELSETLQRLSKVQERLTVAEQVTAATLQRELQESGNSDELQLELTPQHQSTTHTGDVWIS